MTHACTLGPYHPALPAPALVRMRVNGSTVLEAGAEIGYGHRNIEGMAAGSTYWQILGLVERLCGMCSHANMLGFSQVVEAMHEIATTSRAERIRVAAAEIERMQSHLFWVSKLASILGYESLVSRFSEIRELILDVSERIGGSRLCTGLIIPGGVSRDVDDASSMADQVHRLKRPLYEAVNTFLNDRSIISRTVGVGILPREEANRLGAVGPVARASGVDTDTRRDSPYAGYESLSFRVVTQTGGDVYSRTIVRVLECFESLKLIEDTLRDLTESPAGVETPALFPAVASAGRVESAGGETYFYMAGDGTERLTHLSVRPASYANAQIIPTVLKGQQVADAPMILASLGLCMSCVER